MQEHQILISRKALVMISRVFLFAVSILVIASCEPKLPKGHKLFVVDKAFCQKMDLPEIEFSVQYPDTMWVDPADELFVNETYNNFYVKGAGGISTEFIALAYYKYNAENGLSFFVDLKTAMLQQYLQKLTIDFDILEHEIGEFVIDGKTYKGFRAKGKAIHSENFRSGKGTYLMQCLLVEPQTQENGLAITFYANESSAIKSYEDFTEKGAISTVWKTLKFK